MPGGWGGGTIIAVEGPGGGGRAGREITSLTRLVANLCARHRNLQRPLVVSVLLHDAEPTQGSTMISLSVLSATLLPAFLCSEVSMVTPSSGDSFMDLPLHIERPSENSVRLWVGDHISSTAVAALSTDKGIVVIDSTASPTLDEYFRTIIARELGRDDFAYLINTHEHADHTSGNSVYSDCVIIAHDRCADGMRADQARTEERIGWLSGYLSDLEAEVAQADMGSVRAKRSSEDLIRNALILDDLVAGITPAFPTLTFSDTLLLDLGNMTLELYYMGGVHTASDTFILVPEEGLLFTGDVMADEWFTETPGCLQSFALRENTERNTPVLMKNWRHLLARKDVIKDYIPGHWNGDLQHKGFSERHDYVDVLHTGIALAIKEGRGIEDILREFDARAKFPHLVRTPGFTVPGNHLNSILTVYGDLTGMRSAVHALRTGVEEGHLKATVSALRADHAKGDREYFYLEAGFNQLGYLYVGEERFNEALAVFELATEFYPTSWNAFDSYAECCKATGAFDLAESNYLKSIELNPENAERANRYLKEIRDARAAAKAGSESSSDSL